MNGYILQNPRPSHPIGSSILILTLLAVVTPLQLAAASGPRAVVVEIDGGATVLEDSGGAGAPAPRRLQALDLVGSGNTVALQAGQRIALLCSTERLVRVDGPARWRLDDGSCGQGRRQPPGTFDGVVPERGRLVRFGDVLALEMTTRDEHRTGVPVLLAPRNTAVLDPAPDLVWTAVPGAVKYRVEVMSLATLDGKTVEVEPGEAGCGEGLESWPGIEVCSLPWSSLASSAEPPGGTVSLTVGAQVAMGGPLRSEDHRPRIHWLTAAKRRQLEERRALARGQEDPFLRATLEARAVLELELYEEARRRLLEALAVRSVPALRVSLGDLYMEIGLPARAMESYRGAAETATGAAVRGAAEYGLGRASYAMSRYGQAREHFERAADHFGRAGLTPERTAAARSAAHTADRIRDEQGS